MSVIITSFPAQTNSLKERKRKRIFYLQQHLDDTVSNEQILLFCSLLSVFVQMKWSFKLNLVKSDSDAFVIFSQKIFKHREEINLFQLNEE